MEFDLGNEWNNKEVKKLFEQNNIEYTFFNKKISPNAIMKIERFNRTLREKIDAYMVNYKTYRWIVVLP